MEDAPLPEHIYNPPLDAKIEPLVRALTFHGLTTSGSCQGHLNHEKWNHPWVSFMQQGINELAVCRHLVRYYNKQGNAQWKIDGCALRSCSSPTSQSELEMFQMSARELADVLFDYRPEVLDGVPTPHISEREYQSTGQRIDLLYKETDTLLKNPSPRNEGLLKEKFKLLIALTEKEVTFYEAWLYFSPEKAAARLKRVKELVTI